MYASLLISLLAAFVAMLGKQWLNRYLRNSGGSMIERCGDRQRKCDGLQKWPLHFFVESLPVMLQVALLLLACGLCRYMWPINGPVAGIITGLTGIGVVFYIGIVIAGMSSYACPFQTPASVALRGLWKKVQRGIVLWEEIRRGIVSIVRSKRVLSRTRQMWNRGVRSLLHPQYLPIVIPLEDIRGSEPWTLLENTEVHQSEPWMKPMDPVTTRRTNTNDVGCVSWILRNITDPEALDAAIRLAGTIRWFDDGIDVDPPYDLIVSTFKACFDPTRKPYPGSRDRAYYSGRAIMWIHALAAGGSEDSASRFPLLGSEYAVLGHENDLEHLLWINTGPSCPEMRIARLLDVNPGHTPSHSQWTSNLLLHLSWAKGTTLKPRPLLGYISDQLKTKTTLPLSAVLDRLLVWCIFLGSPVEGEALKIQDKS
jgi:hypothetical protein